MNRRQFAERMVAGLVTILSGGWTAVRKRTFPGRLRKLAETNWKEQGKWLG